MIALALAAVITLAVCAWLIGLPFSLAARWIVRFIINRSSRP